MVVESLWRAVVARVRWAVLGGLKEESRMRRVLGGVSVGGEAGWGVRLWGWTVWRRRKVEDEAWKSLRAVERWVGRDL